MKDAAITAVTAMEGIIIVQIPDEPWGLDDLNV